MNKAVNTAVKRSKVHGHKCKDPRLCILCSSVVGADHVRITSRARPASIKKKLLTLAKVALFVPCLISVGASKAGSTSTEIQCYFDGAKSEEGLRRTAFFQSYKFDIEQAKVKVSDDYHEAKATKVYGFNNVTLLEQLETGDMVTTTIVFNDGEHMEAVQSRHETLNHHVTPFQSLGVCNYS